MGLRATRFGQRIGRASRICIDTAPIVYHLENVEPWSELTTLALDRVSEGTVECIVSAVSVTELLVRPYQLENLEAIEFCERFLLSMPNLRIVPVDYELARRAASIRARHRLRTPDSIIMATAIGEAADLLLTNDPDFEKAESSETRVLLMSRFLR
ncbi:MAG TPA: PIN domain-containing protein [Thermoanaerobaculia bacterium]|nr:PIN domain-containing protein [Thermoanaerobaculia bacterium]